MKSMRYFALVVVSIIVLSCNKKTEDISIRDISQEATTASPGHIETAGDFTEDTKEAAREVPKYPLTLYVTSPEGLNFREKPNGKVKFTLDYRSDVEILEAPLNENKDTIDGEEGFWVRVRFYDDEGWVFSAYLSEEDPAPQNFTHVSYGSIQSGKEINKELIKSFAENPFRNFCDNRIGLEKELKLPELLNAAGPGYKMLSWNGPQGGNRWDKLTFGDVTITYIRSYRSDDIYVWNIKIKKTDKYQLNLFDSWPDNEEAVVNILGDYNSYGKEWIVYDLSEIIEFKPGGDIYNSFPDDLIKVIFHLVDNTVADIEFVAMMND